MVNDSPAECSASTRASARQTSISRTPSAIPWWTRSRISSGWSAPNGHSTRWYPRWRAVAAALRTNSATVPPMPLSIAGKISASVRLRRLASVSLSTVSYALSGTRPVSQATKDRIGEAMAELGYRPNAMARGLASRRSRTLALIFPAMESGIGGTVAEFVRSAAATARQRGYHLVLWPFGADQPEEIRDLVHQG